MNAKIPVAAVLWLLLLGAAEPTASFVELFKASTAAHEAKDYVAMEQKLREALKLWPVHPAATYNLAAALALRGERKEAMETLESLVRMGLFYEPAKDPDFAALANSDRFADINKDFARNARPAGRTRTVIQMRDRPSFIPEGLAYDTESHDYFIGSAHHRLIRRVRTGETDQPFVLPGVGPLWVALGMVADPERNLLWVATSAIPEMDESDPKDLGRAAILGYDTRSGERKRRYLLEDAGEHLLGDVTLARNGKLYATDSKAGLLYEVDTTSGKFTALTKPGELASPRGVAQGSDRGYLFVADYTQGLFRYDLRRRELRKLDVSRDICVYGIDGLYRYGEELVAVQNGVRPHRVIQLTLEDRGRRVRHARVLASGQPYFDEPTRGVVIGDHFDFIANSQWSKFDAQHKLPADAELRSPLVLRVELEEPNRNARDTLNPNPTGAGPASQPLVPSLPCVGPLCR